MCMFAQPVESVNSTSIFARSSSSSRQFIVYSMNLATKTDNAMVLALPTPGGAGDDAVRFINLESYPDFFTDMRNGFPATTQTTPSLELSFDLEVVSTLPVHEVGEYEASFVPTVHDWQRLDERFRLSRNAWDTLPGKYQDFGFAVFQVKASSSTQHFHPMAFEFSRSTPDRLFFPTVHVHDGRYHQEALFDHVLYMQCDQNEYRRVRTDIDPGVYGGSSEDILRARNEWRVKRKFSVAWETSKEVARAFVEIQKVERIVDGERPVFRRMISGVDRNDDILV